MWLLLFKNEPQLNNLTSTPMYKPYLTQTNVMCNTFFLLTKQENKQFMKTRLATN